MSNKNISEMNIFQRMAGITAELKNGVALTPVETTGDQTGFNAIRERDVLAAIRPLEEKYGIYSFPTTRELKTSTASNLFIDFVKVVYRFVNIDKPEEYIDVESYGRGIDSYDKSPGKAMTYADKYALMKAYKICGNDAMDNDAAAPDTMLSLPQEPETSQPSTIEQPVAGFEPSQPIINTTRKSSDAQRTNPMMAAYSARSRATVQSNPQSAQNPVAEPVKQSQRVAVKAEQTSKTSQPSKVSEARKAAEQQSKVSETQPSKAGSIQPTNKPTMEEARAFKLTIGDSEIKGKTLGEVLVIEPKLVEWYATSPKFNADRSEYNRNLRACCLTLIEK